MGDFFVDALSIIRRIFERVDFHWENRGSLWDWVDDEVMHCNILLDALSCDGWLGVKWRSHLGVRINERIVVRLMRRRFGLDCSVDVIAALMAWWPRSPIGMMEVVTMWLIEGDIKHQSIADCSVPSWKWCVGVYVPLLDLGFRMISPRWSSLAMVRARRASFPIAVLSGSSMNLLHCLLLRSTLRSPIKIIGVEFLVRFSMHCVRVRSVYPSAECPRYKLITAIVVIPHRMWDWVNSTLLVEEAKVPPSPWTRLGVAAVYTPPLSIEWDSRGSV